MSFNKYDNNKNLVINELKMYHQKKLIQKIRMIIRNENTKKIDKKIFIHGF